MNLPKQLVIYTRFSTDLQNERSCADQEREVRAALTRMKIDDSQALVIHDEAESGTKTFRDEFAHLVEMVQREEIRILAVDDQARLSRADNAFGFITDLVFSNGRFISTGEGIDTTQQGWELRVKVMELHNSTTISELGRRVRRGQLGRVLAGLSAGDFPYGYEAYYLHPEEVSIDRRGPKPKKGLRFNETEAKWVRWIFDRFIEGWSIGAIARELTEQKAPTPSRRCGSRWTAERVRKILGNAKYIGVWHWGQTTTLRNSKGKTRQQPVPAGQGVTHQRPDLRIIAQAAWDKTQQRLRELKDLFGHKVGQRRRGPKVHHLEVYPGSLLGGLLFCGLCGRRLWYHSSGPRHYFRCPNRGHGADGCSMTTTILVAKAEKALLDFLNNLLLSWPEWVANALAEMRRVIQETATRIPAEITADEKRLAHLEKQIDNWADSLAEVRSQTIASRLAAAEVETEDLRKRIEHARQMLAVPVGMPDDAWIAAQLKDLASLIRQDERRAALLLRKILGKVYAFQVLPPGKERGYARLRFKVNGWAVLRAILDGQIPDGVTALLIPNPEGKEGLSDEFQIDLGGPSRMDVWAPKIAEMRAQGVPWKEIWRITGLGSGPAYVTWKRYVDAQNSGPDSPPAELPQDQPDEDSGEHPNAA
jgi:site-specific DNA recombinase